MQVRRGGRLSPALLHRIRATNGVLTAKTRSGKIRSGSFLIILTLCSRR